MNKLELVHAIAERAGVEKKVAEKVLDATTAAISEALAKREEVKLVGFGVFSARARAARNGRNPKTGAALKIAATVAPAFSAGALLKQAVKAKARPQKAKR